MSTGSNSDTPRLADLIVKAGRVYAMDGRGAVFRSLAVRDGWIVAASEQSDGLDPLAGEANRRGQLRPGQLADFVGYRTDPVTAPVDELPGLEPALTCVGGFPAHDPEGLSGRPVAVGR